jgi:hypothetical protein
MELQCKKLIYTSCNTGIFIFKPVLGQVVFSLTFPWTGWFRNYVPVLEQVAISFAFQFKVFGRGWA